jgi:hypothetical protein
MRDARRSKGRTGVHFAHAIKAHGPDAFSCVVLQSGMTLEAARVAEAFATDLLCATNPQFGFNILRGGGAKDPSLYKNPWLNTEYRERGLKSLRETSQTPDVRARRRRTLKATLALRPKKTHCPHGHEYTAENTYVSKRGRRSCITCQNDRQRVSARIRYAPIKEANRLKRAQVSRMSAVGTGGGCSPSLVFTNSSGGDPTEELPVQKLRS